MQNITFQIWNNQITFSSDVKTWLKQATKLNKKSHQYINKYIDILKNPDNSSKLLLFTDDLAEYVNLLITDINDYGKYDIISDDYYNAAQEYISALKQDYSELNKFSSKVKELTDTQIELGYKEAIAKANSSVTGVGYRMFTNNILAALYYDYTNNSAINRQTKQAAKQLDKDYDAVIQNATSHATKVLFEYYQNVFLPSVINHLSSIMQQINLKHLNILDEIKVINLRALEQFDINRSNGILNNLKFSNNKTRTLYEALKYCPFNLKVYSESYLYDDNHKLFNDDLLTIIDYFDLNMDLHELLVNEYTKEFDYSSSLDNYIINYSSIFHILSYIMHIDYNSYLNAATGYIYESYLQKIKDLYHILNDNTKMISFFKSLNIPKEITSKEICEHIFSDNAISKSNFDYLFSTCGHDNLYKQLSDILKCHITDFENFHIQIISIIDTAKHKFELYTQQEIEDNLKQNKIKRQSNIKTELLGIAFFFGLFLLGLLAMFWVGGIAFFGGLIFAFIGGTACFEGISNLFKDLEK